MPRFLLSTPVCSVACLWLSGAVALAATFYVDADGGNDGHAGTSPGQAWATLAQASSRAWLPGDRILLQRGDTYSGKLYLNGARGTDANPIVVAAYGDGPPAVVNASGYRAGVHLRNAAYIEVRDLEIIGDGGEMVDGSPEGERHGVLVDQTGSTTFRSIAIRNLYLHDIYPNVGSPHEGRTPTTHLGFGVTIRGASADPSTDIRIEGCRIERTGFKAIEMRAVNFVEVLNNDLQDIGGPAIQPSRVNDLVVRGNTVDGSGSFVDARMHGRGSGIWPWGSERVLIEKNAFMHARGKADSCGVHIDFNCRDVIVQHNLSLDNEGGFIEILGNNHNCTYRYNISINDGARVKGQDGAQQDGHLLWSSGYVGSNNPRTGPFNTYIYNNTIYVKGDIRSTFSIQESTDGLLVANNIFYVEGTSVDATAAGFDDYSQAMIDRVVWTNNLYQRTGIFPDAFPFADRGPVIADPLFAHAGGLAAEDYIPGATSLIENRGIIVKPIPGDLIGVQAGLAVREDFLGRPVVGLPDVGAIELGGTPFPLPAAAFAVAPALLEADAASMTSVSGPYNTEYFFAEVSGNYGGDDSGWQPDPTYVDEGLLPNTTYAYTVSLRNALDETEVASTEEPVRTPGRTPFQPVLVVSEDFSSPMDPANRDAPFPEETWHLRSGSDWSREGQDSSVTVTGSGQLRVGWGYDEAVVYWYASRAWDVNQGYRFLGDWTIENTLDVHLGLVVGFGEFDPETGALVRRIKEETIGELAAPVVGQEGAFVLGVTSEELQAAGVSGDNRVGVFFHHDDDGVLNAEHASVKNDVYTVDHLALTLGGGEEDTDGDGIPDSVEPGLGLDAHNGLDGSGDLDADGRDNYAEFLAGSNPNDPEDVFAVSLTLASGDPALVLYGGNILAGRLYILEHSSTLDAWKAVAAISGTGAGPSTDRVVGGPAPGTKGLLRIRVEWE